MKIVKSFECNNLILTQRSVVTFGNFDGIHLAHQELLSCVKELAIKHSMHSITLTFYPHTLTLLQKKYADFCLTTLEQKISLIADFAIDYLCVINFNNEFRNVSAEDFITQILQKKCSAKHIVTGPECSFGYKGSGNLALLHKLSKTYDYHLHTLTPCFYEKEVCSSSAIRHYLSAGEMSKVNGMLNRKYTIRGKVVRGKARGRLLGFPTINILWKELLQPKFGVYSGRICYGDDKWYNGVINIGIRPTFENNNIVILEMHIFSFTGDLYDREVTIQLFSFIRTEKRFTDVTMLKKQIQRDIDIAQNAFCN